MEAVLQHPANDNLWRIWRCQQRYCHFLERAFARNSLRLLKSRHLESWWNQLLLEGSAYKRIFGQKAQQCKGSKKSKLWVTVAFIVNAAREREKPVLIWKSENPRFFKHVKKDQAIHFCSWWIMLDAIQKMWKESSPTKRSYFHQPIQPRCYSHTWLWNAATQCLMQGIYLS